MKETQVQNHSPARYGTVAQAIHWATALLVLVAFLYGPGGSEKHGYAVERDFERQLHETLGLCVFVLVLLRVLWRLVDTRPSPAPGPRWMQLAAKMKELKAHSICGLQQERSTR